MKGKATRIGLYKCYQCRKQFTVKVGTVFEDSHVPMNLWLQAMYLLCSSKKGISSNQLHRPWASLSKPLGSCRTASAKPCALSALSLRGGAGEIIEIDETFTGRQEGQPKRHSAGVTRTL